MLTLDSIIPFRPSQFSRNPVDMTGARIGRLTVLGCTGQTRSTSYKWLCRCDCGTLTEVSVASLRHKEHPTQSCGCLIAERRQAAKITHGDTRSPEYKAFGHAKERCKPTHPAHARYYDRGIRFLFTSYEHFLECVGRRPSPEHSIDRIDNDGNYEPGNVRWATKKEQSANRSRTRWTKD
jgi:hypothetical protein